MSEILDFKIDFLKYRKLTIVISALFLSAGFAAYFINGGFKYSVDFTGGMEVLFRFEKDFSRDKLRKGLQEDGWEDVILRDFSKEEVLVRVHNPEEKDDQQDLRHVAEKMQSSIVAEIKDNPVEIMEINSVGKGVGQELWKSSLYAMILALMLMLLYITIRFKFSFSMGAVVALMHDTMAILSLFLIFNREISPYVISAVLATLGYSINDTIVIFTCVRENIKKLKGTPLSEVVNISINHMLRRTLLTSLSTALVVGSLFIFGGETLRNLSLALLIGIIFGTYSSIYIASPVMMSIYKGGPK
ncbi:protein translocase subunit SecF [bacterium]|jgi:preprotein translocase SecF subunit|nr:protein translocase subunit SecF [bacterium]